MNIKWIYLNLNKLISDVFFREYLLYIHLILLWCFAIQLFSYKGIFLVTALEDVSSPAKNSRHAVIRRHSVQTSTPRRFPRPQSGAAHRDLLASFSSPACCCSATVVILHWIREELRSRVSCGIEGRIHSFHWEHSAAAAATATLLICAVTASGEPRASLPGSTLHVFSSLDSSLERWAGIFLSCGLVCSCSVVCECRACEAISFPQWNLWVGEGGYWDNWGVCFYLISFLSIMCVLVWLVGSGH